MPLLLARSLEQISNTAQQALAIAGLLALAPFDRATVAAALDSEANALRRPLNELLNFGLLLRQGERYVISHALILTYARKPSPQPSPGGRGSVSSRPPEALPRLLAYFTQLTRQQDERGRAGYERLDAERRHLLALLGRCSVEQAEAAFTLLNAINDYLRFRGYTTEWRLAWETGLRLAQAANDNQEQANCIKALGDVHYSLDEYEAARQRYEAARPIYHAIGHRLGEANCIKALGDVHRMLAEYEAARQRYEQAQPIYAQIGARLGEANCIRALGDVHLRLAEYEAARQRYEAARPIYHAIGHRLGEANCIKALGDVHLRLAEYEAARQRYEAARPIYHAIGARLGEANCIDSLGQLAMRQQDWSTAKTTLQAGLQIYQTINSTYDIAWSHYFLGQVAVGQDDRTAARQHYQAALERFEAIGLAAQVEMVRQALAAL